MTLCDAPRNRNGFINKLYPQGLTELVVFRSLELTFQHFIFHLLVKQKPAIEVKKWGRWGCDYQALECEFYGTLNNIVIRKMASNWECRMSVSKEETGFSVLHFEGAYIDVKIFAESWTYQKARPVQLCEDDDNENMFSWMKCDLSLNDENAKNKKAG